MKTGKNAPSEFLHKQLDASCPRGRLALVCISLLRANHSQRVMSCAGYFRPSCYDDGRQVRDILSSTNSGAYSDVTMDPILYHHCIVPSVDSHGSTEVFRAQGITKEQE